MHLHKSFFASEKLFKTSFNERYKWIEKKTNPITKKSEIFQHFSSKIIIKYALDKIQDTQRCI